MAINKSNSQEIINLDALAHAELVGRQRFVQHYRFGTPLKIEIDGKKRIAIVRWKGTFIMFGVAIYADSSTILAAGIQSSMHALEEVDQCILCTKEYELFELLKTKQFSVLIVTLNESHIGEKHYEFIKQVKMQFCGLRIVAIAPRISKDVVFQTIKMVQTAFLSADATVQELTEAIYTIRGGYEYFSSSITSLLVNKYVEAMRNETGTQDNPSAKLGRER